MRFYGFYLRIQSPFNTSNFLYFMSIELNLNSMVRILLYLLLIAMTNAAVWSQSDDCACCSADHRAFDFWIGEWEVTDPDGKIVGTNNIQKAQDGCVLVEDWKSSNGTFTGGSTNFFNNQNGQWEQLWIDNSGSHLHLKGRL